LFHGLGLDEPLDGTVDHGVEALFHGELSKRDLRQGYPRWSSVLGQEARFSGGLTGLSI
jgi:hypothetical protein